MNDDDVDDDDANFCYLLYTKLALYQVIVVFLL